MTSSSRPPSTMTARTASRGGPLSARPRRDAGDVAHLAPRPRLGLAVELHPRRRASPARRRPSSPSRFCHLGVGVPRAVAERPAADRADVLLELVDQAGGLGPVAGVVHPRRDLVHHQPAPGHEQLDADHPDIVERGQDPPGDQHRVLRPARPAPPPAPGSGTGCRRGARSRPGRRPRPRRRARAPRSPRSRARSRRSPPAPTARAPTATQASPAEAPASSRTWPLPS